MADLKNILQAAKQQKNSPNEQKSVPKQNNHVSENMVIGNIESLDDMVFGKPDESSNEIFEEYPNNVQRKVYSAEEEMREIKNGGYDYQSQISNSKMPKQILESLIESPLDMKPINEANEEVMSQELHNRTLDIINKLDMRDKSSKLKESQEPSKETLYETENPCSHGSNFSLSELSSIIENIVDKKFKQYGNMLTESVDRNNVSKLGIMTIGDKFRFMDDIGNVYECTMKFIGKGKIKNK